MNHHPIHAGYGLPNKLPSRHSPESSADDSALPPSSISTSDGGEQGKSSRAFGLDESEAILRREATEVGPDAPPHQRFRPGSVEPIYHESGLHAMTIAPTGAGKGRSQIIPRHRPQGRERAGHGGKKGANGSGCLYRGAIRSIREA